MKGTRLYKPAGSPLIQGRSRRERPFVADVASSAAVTLGAGAVIAYLLWGGGVIPPLSWALNLLAVLLVAGVLGGLLGVWLARTFGWHPRWVAGSLVGAVLGLSVLWGFVF